MIIIGDRISMADTPYVAASRWKYAARKVGNDLDALFWEGYMTGILHARDGFDLTSYWKTEAIVGSERGSWKARGVLEGYTAGEAYYR